MSSTQEQMNNDKVIYRVRKNKRINSENRAQEPVVITRYGQLCRKLDRVMLL